MKLEIPSAPKAPAPELPKNTYGKVLGSTPVVMTVVSTLMAGLSNSEMTRGQYDRSTAAQIQSKVGDQWSFYQARRLRSANFKSGELLLTASADTMPLTSEMLQPFLAGTPIGSPTAASSNAVHALITGALPEVPRLREEIPSIRRALDAIAEGRSEGELLSLVAAIPGEELSSALQAAQTESVQWDKRMGELSRNWDAIERQLAAMLSQNPDTVRPIWRNFAAARMHLESLRLDAEAKASRPVADLLELQVRQGNRDAERHRVRSGKFFIGMLVSQVAVVIGTFALAVQRRNLIWAVAASLGLAATAFGLYAFFLG